MKIAPFFADFTLAELEERLADHIRCEQFRYGEGHAVEHAYKLRNEINRRKRFAAAKARRDANSEAL